MSRTRAHAQNAFEQGAEALRKMPQEAIDAAEALSMEARDQAREVMENTCDQARELSSSIASAIRAKPFQSVGIAMGIGCLVGLVFARR